MTTTNNSHPEKAQNKAGSSDIVYLYGALTTKSYVHAAMVLEEQETMLNALSYAGLAVAIKRKNILDDPSGYPAGFDTAAYSSTNNQNWAPAFDHETKKWKQPHNRPAFVAFRSKEYAMRYATHMRLLDAIYEKIPSETAVQEIEKWCGATDDLTRLARDIGCPELEPTMLYGEEITVGRPLEFAYLYDAKNEGKKISRVLKTPDIAQEEEAGTPPVNKKSVCILADGIAYRATGYDPEQRCYTELKANDERWVMSGSKRVFLDEDDAVYYSLMCEIKKGVAAGLKNIRVPDGVYSRTNVTAITLYEPFLTKVAKDIADWLMPIRSKNKK